MFDVGNVIVYSMLDCFRCIGMSSNLCIKVFSYFIDCLNFFGGELGVFQVVCWRCNFIVGYNFDEVFVSVQLFVGSVSVFGYVVNNNVDF